MQQGGRTISECDGYPVVISNASYLAYNRVPKAASTLMKVMFAKEQKARKKGRNSEPKFELIDVQRYYYYPHESAMLYQMGGKADLIRGNISNREEATFILQIRPVMPVPVVYINHAFLLPQLPLDDFAWINVAREPVERLMSRYYYLVDSSNRAWSKVKKTVETKQKEGACGCYTLEFDECIEALIQHRCDIAAWNHLLQPQFLNFCPAPRSKASTTPGQAKDSVLRSTCNSDIAIANIKRMYSFIGLTSQMSLSMDAFAKLVPNFMLKFPQRLAAMGSSQVGSSSGATNTSTIAVPHRNVGSRINNLTGTVMNGLVTEKAKVLLRSHWIHYADEVAVYTAIESLFWCKVGALGLSS